MDYQFLNSHTSKISPQLFSRFQNLLCNCKTITHYYNYVKLTLYNHSLFLIKINIDYSIYALSFDDK